MDTGAAFSETLERARRFVETSQKADGRWLDFRFRFLVGDTDVISSQWVTAYVGESFARAGGASAALARARDWLLANQHPGGAWGFSRATPADADSTANAVRFLARWREVKPWDGALAEACAQLLRYWDEPGEGFRTYRLPDQPDPRGWATFPGSSWCDVHLCVTALAAGALHAAGPERHRRLLEACARHVAERQAPEGFWEAYWWQGRTYSTHHAARLLALLGEAPERISRAVDWTLQARAADGGWGNGLGGEPAAFHTALSVSTLLLDPRHRQGPEVREGIAWLMRHQQADGGWANVPVMRMPRLDEHEPWKDPEGCLLIPVLTDRNRLFTTATVLHALVDWRDAMQGA